jgi:hypothetical protein
MASAKTQAHRDGDLAIGPALPSQEDVGAGPLASNVALAAQGAQSYLCYFPVPRSRSIRVALLRSPYRLKFAHRVSYFLPRLPLEAHLLGRGLEWRPALIGP